MAVLFGAALALFAPVIVTLLPECARRISVGIDGFPDWIRAFGRQLRRPRRIVAAVIALAATIAGFVYVPTLGDGLEPGELTILSAFDEGANDPRRILVDQWNRTHPDNQVQIVDAPGEPDQQHKKMVDEANLQDGQTADIYVLDNVWTTEFIEHDYIRPLGTLQSTEESDFFDNVLDTNKDMYAGKDGEIKPGLWGLPLNADAGLLFRVGGLGAPTSWEEYSCEGAAQTLAGVKADPAFGQLGATVETANAAQLADEEILTVTAFEAIWAADGEVVNRDGKLVFGQDGVEFDAGARAGVKELALCSSNPSVTWPPARSATEADALTAFKDGKALFMRNWPVAYDALRGSNDRSAPAFEVGALPGGSVLGGQNLAISRQTDKPRAAQALIEFLTSSASQLILFEVGGFAPSRSDVYDQVSKISRPYAETLRSEVARARHRPFLPNYVEFSEAFRHGVLQALDAKDGSIDSKLPGRLAEIARK